MEPKKVNILGMEIDEWCHKSCDAHVGVGEDWATIYDIQSRQERNEHATELLLIIKKYYEGKGLSLGGSIALNERMAKLYQKCKIREYT